jgi:spermidine/putrescine transport system permease protein
MKGIPTASLPAAIWWSAFFIVPFVGLLAMSAEANFATAFDPLYRAVLFTTLRTAAIGTVLCVLAGFPVAYALAYKVEERWRPLLLVLLMLPYWTSFLLRTIAWRIILAPQGPLEFAALPPILDTNAAVQIGIVYNYLPLSILPIYVALERIPRSLRAASMDLGANRLVTFLTITLPLAAPGIGGALLVTFVLAAGDYVVPALLGGARGLMIGSLIATQTLAAQNVPLGSAIAVVLLLSLALVAGAAWIAARTAGALARFLSGVPR